MPEGVLLPQAAPAQVGLHAHKLRRVAASRPRCCCGPGGTQLRAAVVSCFALPRLLRRSQSLSAVLYSLLNSLVVYPEACLQIPIACEAGLTPGLRVMLRRKGASRSCDRVEVLSNFHNSNATCGVGSEWLSFLSRREQKCYIRDGPGRTAEASQGALARTSTITHPLFSLLNCITAPPVVGRALAWRRRGTTGNQRRGLSAR